VLETGESILNVEVERPMPADPEQMLSWLESFYAVLVDGENIGVGAIIVDVTSESRRNGRDPSSLRRPRTPWRHGRSSRPIHLRPPEPRWPPIASAIAVEMGLDHDTIEGIDLAARIHDIGKIGTPAEILKPSHHLSPMEWELIKIHAQAGADIIKGSPSMAVAEMIVQHHERLDGSGYPCGLRGEEICLGARIIAVADTVEAMSSHRPYRPALGVEAAVEEIVNDAAGSSNRRSWTRAWLLFIVVGYASERLGTSQRPGLPLSGLRRRSPY